MLPGKKSERSLGMSGKSKKPVGYSLIFKRDILSFQVNCKEFHILWKSKSMWLLCPAVSKVSIANNQKNKVHSKIVWKVKRKSGKMFTSRQENLEDFH